MQAQRGLRRLSDEFPDVAARDEWGIEAVDAKGRPALLALVESYCVDASCDCRRAVIELVWVRDRARAEVATVIVVDLRAARPRGQPMFEPHPDGPRGRDATVACDVVERVVAREPGFVEMLRGHYELMKAGPAGSRRAGGKGGARRAASGPAKGEASGASARGAQMSGAAMVVAKVAKGEGKVQRRFRKVMAKVDELRKRVHDWRTKRPDVESRIAAYTAAVERQHGVMREMVLVLDDRFAHPSLTKKDRRRVSQVIGVIAHEVLEHGAHQELIPFYNRHARTDFDEDARRADAEQTAELRADLEEQGVEFGDAEVSTLDQLTDFVEGELRAAQEEEQQRAAKAAERRERRKTKAQRAADEARAEERRLTERTLQEVYRALAKELHPDREQDPDERTRKAELMRDANVAYEARDLLRLLELELAVERVDGREVDTLAEERVLRYCRILDEQARHLEDELAATTMPYWMAITMRQPDQDPPRSIVPEDVLAHIAADIADVEERTAELAADLEIFREPAQLKRWLQRRTAPRWDRDPFGDADEDADADAAFRALFG